MIQKWNNTNPRVSGRGGAGVAVGRSGGARPYPITLAGVIAPHRPFASSGYLAGRLREAGGRPVRLWISSSGGSVDEAHEICAALAEYPGEVVCEAVREVSSAAVLIFASGDRRIARESATFTLHKRAIDRVPAERLTAAALRSAADFLTKVDMDCAAFIAARCGVSTAEISKLESQEATLNAYQAHRLGLVHEVITPMPQKRQKQDQRAQSPGLVLPGRVLMGISRQAADRLVLQGRLPAALHSSFGGGRVAL